MTEQSTYTQQEQGWMMYPGKGWRKFLFKMPLYLWRLGLGRLLPSNFLLLTTTGRKSGLPRRTMLESATINGRFYLGSGWGKKSQWYRNIEANPFVTVQTVREGTIRGKAVLVTDDEELAKVYEYVRGVSPTWKEYLDSWGVEDTVQDFVAKKDRLPTLRIDPVEAPTPPPLPADLVWVWPLFSLSALLILWFTRHRA